MYTPAPTQESLFADIFKNDEKTCDNTPNAIADSEMQSYEECQNRENVESQNLMVTANHAIDNTISKSADNNSGTNWNRQKWNSMVRISGNKLLTQETFEDFKRRNGYWRVGAHLQSKRSRGTSRGSISIFWENFSAFGPSFENVPLEIQKK